MSLIGWIILGVYLAGFLWAFRTLTGMLAWDMKGNYQEFPSGDDWGFAIFVGGLLSAIWPITLPIAYGITQMSSNGGGAWIFYMPPEHRLKLREERLALREEEVKKLERELLDRP